MNAYTKKFSPFYDKGWNNFSVRVFNFFKEIIKNKDVCDVACGTGNFIKLAKRITKSICGIDISRDFIVYAKKKNPKVSFRALNVEKWKDKDKYDLIVSFYDSVNHFDDWEKAFKKIYNALRENGKFIFDINTVEGVSKWNDICLNRVAGGHVYIEGRALSKYSAKINLKIFNQKGCLIDNVNVFEKTYPIKKVITILKSAGFKEVKNIGNIINPRNKGRTFFECVK